MAISKQTADSSVQTILQVLQEQFGKKHPRADIKAYRYNSASVRIRIIDPAFAGKSLVDREEMVWPIIETLPDAVRSEITVLLLLPPGEKKKSFMNWEFENPSASQL